MKVFEDINKLIVEGSLAVGNHSIVLDFVLGSDYKVIVIIIIMYSTDSMSTSQYLLIVMGLNDSTSNYACLWCTVHREERFVNKHVNNQCYFNFIGGTCHSVQTVAVSLHLSRQHHDHQKSSWGLNTCHSCI